MRYQKSISLLTFEADNNKLIVDLRENCKPSIYSPRSKELIIGSIVSLSFAHFENYISDLIDSWINLVIRSDIKYASIPIELRTFLLAKYQEASFKNYIVNKNEKKLIESIKIGNLYYNLLNDETLITTMNSKTIYQDKKYPSPDNIEALFVRLGVNKVFDRLSKRCKKNMRLVLSSFNDTRTSLVHQGVQPGTNYKDYIKKLIEIRELIRNIDIIFFQEVVKKTKNECWPC